MLHHGTMVQGALETEVKIRVSDLPAILDRIHQAGFTVAKPRLFEANVIYDRRDGPSLKDANMLLRLRQAGERCFITWKGRGQDGPHKARPEIETTVGSVDAMEQILDRLGFDRSFRYEKYRTEFESSTNPGGAITVDETPIGNYLELEGPGEWIDRTASQLGLSQSDYILGSYSTLYQDWCAEHGVAPAHMVFAS